MAIWCADVDIRHVTDTHLQSDYNPVAPLNTALKRAMETVPKYNHGELGYIAETVAFVVEQWVQAELEEDSAHAEYPVKLDDEWAKIEKAREDLIKREEG